MLKGFRPIDDELGWSLADGRLGDFIQVDFGAATDWSLIAEYACGNASVWLQAKPVSYRVQDEGELINYWNRRKEENALVAFAYEIEASPYLTEMRDGVTSLSGTALRHFLFAGENTCVEIIAEQAPMLLTKRPAVKGNL
ncbi:MAG: hypothetical protein C0461_01675 [Brevundimonas sp.]|nr:hypothetical protein [Brevundimonas sp.]